MYEDAIKKLRDMAEDNDKFCSEIESGKVVINGLTGGQLERLMGTYRYWHQCCLMGAWLLSEENKK